MEDVAIEVGLIVGHENRLEGRELTNLLGAEVGWLVEYETVAVTQDVGREPTAHTEHAGADDRSETTLNESLASLEVLTCDGHLSLVAQLPHCWDVDCSVRSTHDEWAVLLECCISIAH